MYIICSIWFSNGNRKRFDSSCLQSSFGELPIYDDCEEPWFSIQLSNSAV